jgi:hypothetical protein
MNANEERHEFLVFRLRLKHGFDFTARAKGVEPRALERVVLRGWRLRFFNVRHFFRHEGGGNIEPSGDPSDVVWGVLHQCESASRDLCGDPVIPR